jgi:hypothetical protein
MDLIVSIKLKIYHNVEKIIKVSFWCPIYKSKYDFCQYVASDHTNIRPVSISKPFKNTLSYLPYLFYRIFVDNKKALELWRRSMFSYRASFISADQLICDSLDVFTCLKWHRQPQN